MSKWKTLHQAQISISCIRTGWHFTANATVVEEGDSLGHFYCSPRSSLLLSASTTLNCKNMHFPGFYYHPFWASYAAWSHAVSYNWDLASSTPMSLRFLLTAVFSNSFDSLGAFCCVNIQSLCSHISHRCSLRQFSVWDYPIKSSNEWCSYFWLCDIVSFLFGKYLEVKGPDYRGSIWIILCNKWPGRFQKNTHLFILSPVVVPLPSVIDLPALLLGALWLQFAFLA